MPDAPMTPTPQDPDSPVAWQITIDGVRVWSESSFFRTEADAIDGLDDGGGNGCVPLYLHPPMPAPLTAEQREGDTDLLTWLEGEWDYDPIAHGSEGWVWLAPNGRTLTRVADMRSAIRAARAARHAP